LLKVYTPCRFLGSKNISTRFAKVNFFIDKSLWDEEKNQISKFSPDMEWIWKYFKIKYDYQSRISLSGK
jgi:hypothetical protein